MLKETCEIVEKLDVPNSHKEAILYILDVLSANMLDGDEKEKYLEGRKVFISPRDEYLTKKGMEKGLEKGKREIALNLLNEGIPISKVCELTGLSEKQIHNAE